MSPEEAKKLVFQYWEHIHRLVEKRFAGDDGLIEEAFNYVVVEKLAANDWLRVRQYRGEGFSSFITVVVRRLLSDFARRTGKEPEAPKWVRERGILWKKAWFLLCVKNLTKQETIEILSEEARQIGRQPEFMEDMVALIIQKQQRRGIMFFRLTEQHVEKITAGSMPSEDAQWAQTAGEADGLSSASPPPPEMLEDLENSLLLESIFLILSGLRSDAPPMQTVDEKKILDWIKRLRQCLNLSDEEYLFLQLIYQDGLTISETGRRLHLNPNQAAGRHRRLLQRMHKAFEKAGLDGELRLLLESLQ